MTKQPRILIVEDSLLDQKMLVRVLNRIGFNSVHIANSVTEFHDLFVREVFDLVVLDVNLPDGSGTEILRHIRERHDAVHLPVIMVTGNSSAEEVSAALTAGANDYITKPVQIEIVAARIGSHLKIREMTLRQLDLKQIETRNAMIVTYNHQLNTPLFTALLALDLNSTPSQKDLEILRSALTEATDIVKAIRTLMDTDSVEIEPYVGAAGMMKIKKTSGG